MADTEMDDSPMPVFLEQYDQLRRTRTGYCQKLFKYFILLFLETISLQRVLELIEEVSVDKLGANCKFPGVVRFTDDTYIHGPDWLIRLPFAYPDILHVYTPHIFEGNFMQLAIMLDLIPIVQAMQKKGLSIHAGIHSRLDNFEIAISLQLPKMVDCLIQCGTDPNCFPAHKIPPLSLAILSGNLQVVEVLLKAGANPNCFSIPIQKVRSRHPLLLAETIEMADLLIRYKSDPNIMITENCSLMVYAIKYCSQSCIQNLIDHGGDLFFETIHGFNQIYFYSWKAGIFGFFQPCLIEKAMENGAFAYGKILEKHRQEQREKITRQFHHSNTLFSRTGEQNKRLRFN